MMTIRYTTLFFFVVMITTSCGDNRDDLAPEQKSNTSSKSGAVHISGTLEGGAGKVISLQRIDPQTFRWAFVDSDTIDSDGSFEFASDLESLEIYSITKQTPQALEDYIFLHARGGENIKVTGEYDNMMYSYSVDGSPQSTIERQYRQMTQRFDPVIDSLRRVAADLPFEESEQRGNILGKVEGLKDLRIESTQDFIIKHQDDVAVMNPIMDYINPKRQAKSVDSSDIAFMKETVNALESTFPMTTATSLIKKLTSQVTAEKQIAAQKQAQQERQNNLLKPGTPAPNISLPNPQGKTMSISDLRGKVVLIDFWASWCKPCRRENPNVVRTYNKYKDAGFDIFSVSLDQQKQRWVQAIQQDGLTWDHHVSDLRGWQSSAAQLYNVRGIPFTVLIDKEGKVIATNLRGASLEAKLEEIFGF